MEERVFPHGQPGLARKEQVPLEGVHKNGNCNLHAELLCGDEDVDDQHEKEKSATPDPDKWRATLQVAFLGGDVVDVLLSACSLVSDVKSSVQLANRLQHNMQLVLISGGRLLLDSETALPLMGRNVTAVVTRRDLDPAAAAHLKESTGKEEGDVLDLLEFTRDFRDSEMKLVADILMVVQPRRVIFSGALEGSSLEILSSEITVDLELETLQIRAPVPEKLSLLASILRRCPLLRVCYICGELEAVHVAGLRAEFAAQIVI